MMMNGTHYFIRGGKRVLTARGKRYRRENRQAALLLVITIAGLAGAIMLSQLG